MFITKTTMNSNDANQNDDHRNKKQNLQEKCHLIDYNNDRNNDASKRRSLQSSSASSSWKQQHGDNTSYTSNSYRTDKIWDRSLNERSGLEVSEHSNNQNRKRNFGHTNYNQKKCNNNNNNRQYETSEYDNINQEEVKINIHAKFKDEETYDDDNDPFPSALRCSNYRFSNPLSSNKGQQPHASQLSVLEWYSPRDAIPVENEHRMKSVLIQYGSNERGMFKDQAVHRLDKIKQIIASSSSSSSSSSSTSSRTSTKNSNKNKNEMKLNLIQALSLRRHYMKLYNPFLSMTQLRLGTEKDINTSAKLFENSIEQFLKSNSILYYNERVQKQHIATNKPYNEPYPPTPDFIFVDPIKIRTFRYEEENDNNTTTGTSNQKKSRSEKVVLQEFVVSWMEVKMFYGASTIPSDNKSAVGCILSTATKYVKCHGPGAMIFAYGFGEQLEQQLFNVGVIALDCNYGYHNHHKHSNNETINDVDNGNNNSCVVDLEPVMSHQRTWCANAHGEILP